jgi:predicted GIY-YIG superfamily endonuclease
MSERLHTLYRFYDADGVLLYVGRTTDPTSRLRAHRQAKPWWPDIARIEMQHLASPSALADAEIRAIRDEAPLYNIAGTRARKRTLTRQRGLYAQIMPHGLEIGWAYAIVLHNNACLVGRVARWSTPGAIGFERYSWSTEQFTGVEDLIDPGAIWRVRRATTWRTSDGSLSFDMDDLGDFQDAWHPIDREARA